MPVRKRAQDTQRRYRRRVSPRWPPIAAIVSDSDEAITIRPISRVYYRHLFLKRRECPAKTSAAAADMRRRFAGEPRALAAFRPRVLPAMRIAPGEREPATTPYEHIFQRNARLAPRRADERADGSPMHFTTADEEMPKATPRLSCMSA